MYAANLETFVADAGIFTKAAEKLYISSTAVIKQIDTLEARERARSAMKAKGNVLRVGASPITPPQIVEELCSSMQKEHYCVEGKSLEEISKDYQIDEESLRLIAHIIA